MTARAADALVFFGATGDLAYRKIFPALQELARRGRLAVPVIGVARDGTLDDLRTRARESVESQVGVDQSAFERLMGLLHYVSGDYTDPGTFDRLRRELGDAARPKRRGSRRRGDGSAHCQVDRDRSSAKGVVILSEAKEPYPEARLLRFAQDDRRRPSPPAPLRPG